MSYKVTIGLEIHAELKTETKMFCRCKNDPDEKRPNYNVCPVCTAQPGALPVINKKAVEHVLRVGQALGATLADFTEWDRKNYFYPDIPKGYQISQYKYPLVLGGTLAGIALTRIHLEEDTGKSQHDKGDYSLIDYNRSGVPLMELVTEPVISDAETAVRFAKELQLLLRYLGVAEANMEKGEMRVEANISISKTDTFGTKVEVKNLNSFKSVGDAILFEINRQERALERGEAIVQETRGWDENAGKTFSQRTKETAHDYRYFPEPDLPKLIVTEVFGEKHEKLDALPELPHQRRERYCSNELYGFDADTIEFLVTTELQGDYAGTYFDRIVQEGNLEIDEKKIAVNYIKTDLMGYMKNNPSLHLPHSHDFAELIRMIKAGDITSRSAKDILLQMAGSTNGCFDPMEYAQKNDLLQKNDSEALMRVAKEIIAQHSSVVAEYKAGKQASLQYLVGQAMKATKGSANPKLLADIFATLLS